MPTLFERVSGEPAVVDGLVLDPGDRISFTVDERGDVTYPHTSLHTIALHKVSFLGLGIVHISAFGTIVLVFVLSLLVWPTGAFIRKRRHRRRAARSAPSEPDQPAESVATDEPPAPDEPAGSATTSEHAGAWPPPPSKDPDTPTLLREPTNGARLALWIEIGIAICLLLGIVAFFATVSNSDVAFGPTLSLYLAAGLFTIASLASPMLIPAAVGSWIRGWFTIDGRIFYSLLALTSPYLLWWAKTWNLLGFQF